jgi:hypothetical protein
MRALIFMMSGIACLALQLGCGSQPSASSGGGGIETVAIFGRVVLPDSSVPLQADVYVRRTDFIADTGQKSIAPDAVIDKTGMFRVGSVGMGSYTLEVNDRSGNAIGIHCDIVPGNGDRDIGVATIRPYAAVSGSISLPSGTGGQVYVQVYGLQRNVKTDTAGRYSINDLPAGEYTLRFASSQAHIGPRDTSKVLAETGASTALPPVSLYTFTSEQYTEWKYSRRMVLNTTATGANVGLNVAPFPLLVRLTDADFDFLQVDPSGADLRFSDANGSHLAYEIARFNRAQSQAELWVLLDTVWGNSDTQAITMYWGRPDLTNWSNGAVVFAPASGFAAVWHLDFLGDATGNGNILNNFGAVSAPGISGMGCSLNGSGNFLSVNPTSSLNLGAGNLTIVLWEKTTGHWSNERMFFEHDVWPANGTYSFSTRNDSILSFDFPGAQAEVRGWQGSNSDGAWHCLAATLDDANDTGKIFRDGTLLYADTMRSSIGSSIAASYIGCRGGTERFFKGEIDEVWVLSQERPAEWLKLLYENIRENQVLYRMQ